MSAIAHYRSVRRQIMSRAFGGGQLEDTYGVVTLDELDLAHPDRVHYEPSGWTALGRALRGQTISPTDVFLDYGSGKGRVVQQAARLPFARVLGIEISPDLNAIARRNVERHRERLTCRDVELVCGDVADFEVPDDVTLAYCFNAFVGDTFVLAMEALVRSHDRPPRSLTLVYGHPLMAGALAAHPRFELERVVGRPSRIDRQLYVYRVIEPTAEATT